MPVYLDHAASTPPRPAILEAYLAALRVEGNPSAVHSHGQRQRQSLEDAREKLAQVLNAHRSEVLFTSGGTESNNLAIKGLYLAAHQADSQRRIVISAETEHHAGTEPIEYLSAHHDAIAVWSKISSDGQLDLDWLRDYLDNHSSEVALISLMWANNETGVVFPIAEVGQLAKKYGIAFHSDAVAAFGHTPVDFAASGVTSLSISGHKIGAPVGVGALVIARDAKIVSTSHGGGQEREIRSGTLSTPLAIAFADAAALAAAELHDTNVELDRLAQKLIAGVKSVATDAELSRRDANGLVSTVNFTFPGCSGDSLLFLLDNSGISVSTGSACRAGIAQPSHVLMAMGMDSKTAGGALRISLGYCTTEAEIDEFLTAFPNAYESAKKAGHPTN